MNVNIRNLYIIMLSNDATNRNVNILHSMPHWREYKITATIHGFKETITIDAFDKHTYIASSSTLI